jgi:hypothetical protein
MRNYISYQRKSAVFRAQKYYYSSDVSAPIVRKLSHSKNVKCLKYVNVISVPCVKFKNLFHNLKFSYYNSVSTLNNKLLSLCVSSKQSVLSASIVQNVAG